MYTKDSGTRVDYLLGLIFLARWSCTPKGLSTHRLLTNVMILTQEVYSQKARELEAEGKLREAEKMYCTIKQYDLAIGLYKQHSMWDQVIRLVSQHRKVCHKVVNHILLFCC